MEEEEEEEEAFVTFTDLYVRISINFVHYLFFQLFSGNAFVTSKLFDMT